MYRCVCVCFVLSSNLALTCMTNNYNVFFFSFQVSTVQRIALLCQRNMVFKSKVSAVSKPSKDTVIMKVNVDQEYAWLRNRKMSKSFSTYSILFIALTIVLTSPMPIAQIRFSGHSVGGKWLPV